MQFYFVVRVFLMSGVQGSGLLLHIASLVVWCDFYNAIK